MIDAPEPLPGWGERTRSRPWLCRQLIAKERTNPGWSHRSHGRDGRSRCRADVRASPERLLRAPVVFDGRNQWLSATRAERPRARPGRRSVLQWERASEGASRGQNGDARDDAVRRVIGGRSRTVPEPGDSPHDFRLPRAWLAAVAPQTSVGATDPRVGLAKLKRARPAGRTGLACCASRSGARSQAIFRGGP